MHTNPFLKESYGTLHNTVPFADITLEDYETAIMEGIEEEDRNIKAIIENNEEPTFENTIEALENCGPILERATTVFFNMLSAETSDEMDTLAQKLAPILSEHSSNINLNEDLFKRVKHVYDSKPELNSEQSMLLQNTYDGFVRNGAELDCEDKDRFRKLTNELSTLTLKFSQNVLKDTNNFSLHLTEKEELKGLPESALEGAREEAKERNVEGWVFTLHAPSYVPFMTYCADRELRKKMYMAYNTLCTHDNEYNNFNVVGRIVNIRREIAQLLGYGTYADYKLVKRMAQNKENVYDLLNQLIDAYEDKAHSEVEEIEKLAQESEGADFKIMQWDFSYYSNKLKELKYNINSETLRPYFRLDKVQEGVFGLANRLYGITFCENNDIQVYHKDVKAYEVYDNDGTFLAVLYCDFHPRKTKKSGAWMTSFKEQWIEKDGFNSRPHVSVTMNFTKPSASKPALLTLSEVETFLHEFGHALHGMFANTTYRSLSGTNVYWDFVELPSQIMENFCTEQEFLDTFASHYESGELIPSELTEKIRESKNFNTGYACLRQISFGILDMAYYTMKQPFADDVRSFEKNAWKRTQVLPDIPETCMSTQFSHIMSGGYSAGYYSYKWAEVLDADAFSLFKKNGIFDKKTAESFRKNILSKGGTEHPMTLYKRFRGKAPSIEALLERNGIETKH